MPLKNKLRVKLTPGISVGCSRVAEVRFTLARSFRFHERGVGVKNKTIRSYSCFQRRAFVKVLCATAIQLCGCLPSEAFAWREPNRQDAFAREWEFEAAFCDV